MPFRVSGKNIDVGEALRERINRPGRRSHGEIFRRRLFRPRHHRQGGIRLSHRMRDPSRFRHLLEAEALAADAYASADQAALRIEKRLRRYKRRLKDHQNAPADGRRRWAWRRCGRRAQLRHRDAGARERRGNDRVQSGHHRGNDDHAEAIFGQRGGDGAGSHRSVAGSTGIEVTAELDAAEADAVGASTAVSIAAAPAAVSRFIVTKLAVPYSS